MCGQQVAVVHAGKVLQVIGIAVQVFFGFDPVDKDHVRPGVDVGPASPQSIFPAGDGVGVAAGYDHEIGVGAGIKGGADFLDHLLLWNDLFPLEETALLGE